jgi:hypothetical protein
MLPPTVSNPDWDIFLARYFRLPYTEAVALREAGKLPDERAVPRNPDAQLIYNDRPAIDALESYRPQFDTPLSLFVPALRKLSGHLLDGRNEMPHELALTEFRFFGGRGFAYPLTPRHRPWCNQRCPITRTELERAGYRELAAQWDRPRQDAFRAVGGEARLGPPQWAYKSPLIRPDLRMPRGAFLARLANVLEARPAVQS